MANIFSYCSLNAFNLMHSILPIPPFPSDFIIAALDVYCIHVGMILGLSMTETMPAMVKMIESLLLRKN